MKLALVKTPHGLFPHDPETEAEIRRLPVGTLLEGKFTRHRNPRFHRKFMALVKLAFDLWEQYSQPVTVETPQGPVVPERNFNEFRYWLTIKAGFYDTFAYPDGSVQVRARSIRFAKMSEEEFQTLFSRVIDVVLHDVLHGRMSRTALDQHINRILMFT